VKTEGMGPGFHVCVLPLGEDIGSDVLEIIAANIQAQLSLPVNILPAGPLPEQAYHPARRQFNALAVLEHLRQTPVPDQTKVLGVMKADLFIPILTYVFGEAQLGNRCALVSLYRLQHMRDGSPAPLPLFFQRAAKLGVHELLHTFNIIHCDQEDCIMRFIQDLDAVDAQDLVLCRYCSAFLAEHLQH